MKNRTLGLVAGAGIACSLVASPALADDAARIKELERKLERSMQLIEQLSNKVTQLAQEQSKDQGKEKTQIAAASSVDHQQRIEALERQTVQLGNGLSTKRALDDGVPLHGFADVGIATNGQNNYFFGKGNKGFNVGSLDLYLTPQFGDRVRSLVELVFEVDNEGNVATDLERVQLGYAFNDAATAWLGRFHTPYGYWNTAFHHGAQIQTSYSRPRFLEFEDKGGILPAHSTGAWLTGSMPVSGNRFGYDAYLANSAGIQTDISTQSTNLSARNSAAFNTQVAAGNYAGAGTLNMKMNGNTSGSYMGGFNAWVEPSGIEGLRLGLHGLTGDIKDDVENKTRLQMLGGYGVFVNDRWEIMGEYYNFNNRDLSGSSGTHQSWAGYLQAGYNMGRYTPYVRGEKASLEQKDNYFAVQQYGRSYSRGVIGLRYDLDPKAALKFELSRTQQDDLGSGYDDRYGEAHLQYSIRF